MPTKVLFGACIALGTLAVGSCAALAAIDAGFLLTGTPSSHEVAERHDSVEAIEDRFPTLSGHVLRTDYVVDYMSSDSPASRLVPGPTDYTIWGVAVVDGELAARLRSDYQWEPCEAPSLGGGLDNEIDETANWMTSAALRDEVCGTEVPSESLLAFDGQDTIVFRRAYW